jgi:hypothetical protein
MTFVDAFIDFVRTIIFIAGRQGYSKLRGGRVPSLHCSVNDFHSLEKFIIMLLRRDDLDTQR